MKPKRREARQRGQAAHIGRLSKQPERNDGTLDWPGDHFRYPTITGIVLIAICTVIIYGQIVRLPPIDYEDPFYLVRRRVGHFSSLEPVITGGAPLLTLFEKWPGNTVGSGGFAPTQLAAVGSEALAAKRLPLHTPTTQDAVDLPKMVQVVGRFQADELLDRLPSAYLVDPIALQPPRGTDSNSPEKSIDAS